MRESDYVPGLENVIASETSISYLDVENEQIIIRGYDLMELARQAGYLEVAGLLLDGSLPGVDEKEALEERLKAEYGMNDAIYRLLALLPKDANMMDVLRTGISSLSSYDPELDDRSREANRRKAVRLLAKVPQLCANGYRIVTGHEPLAPRADLPYSAGFLYLLTGREPSELEARLFDQSLIAYSEHEMPNSTFAARVIASTHSDVYGALSGGVASLKGTLHGGANEAVMDMLLEAETEAGMETLVRSKLAAKERIMGFGHRVYMKKPDPRALLMKEALAELSAERGDDRLLRMCVVGETIVASEKKLFPNLDYYAAPVYHLLGIPTPLFTPVFFAARTAGLCAHVMEQHENNRLFRPRVRYTGPRGLRVGRGAEREADPNGGNEQENG
ncbi:citrate synthase [Paenibacillus sp. SCIV0701]|uniref:Citrate synthase n=2 Tax=Paenibacillus soyae TaxID=2969249 RepID=A0A9X2MN78_9BACL|nr:citrate synthase [Paenibacillus soyae]MCR2803844.1 citrate synthase [Paenibacillus soyae]